MYVMFFRAQGLVLDVRTSLVWSLVGIFAVDVTYFILSCMHDYQLVAQVGACALQCVF